MTLSFPPPPFAKQAANRKKALEDSHRLENFLAEYRDLISWTNDLKTIINQSTKDNIAAEAHLERHQGLMTCTELWRKLFQHFFR